MKIIKIDNSYWQALLTEEGLIRLHNGIISYDDISYPAGNYVLLTLRPLSGNLAKAAKNIDRIRVNSAERALLALDAAIARGLWEIIGFTVGHPALDATMVNKIKQVDIEDQ